MRPVRTAAALVVFALVPLAPPGCASEADRLARIEERLAAMDARLAQIDERTKPQLFVPTVTQPWPGAHVHVVQWTDPELNRRMDRAPADWWPILEAGGCVMPRGIRPVTIRSIEFTPGPTLDLRGQMRIVVPKPPQDVPPTRELPPSPESPPAPAPR